MSMRITTNGVFQGYRANLQGSYKRLNKSMSRVASQRNFESYSEDVSAASRAFQLRRSHWQADMQVNNSNYVISKFETAWSSVDFIVDGNETEKDMSGIVEALRGLQDTTGGSRISLGESLISKAESMVRLMNVQYGDQFIFAGADGHHVPFTWDDNGTLLYRGVDVSTPVGLTEAEFKALNGDYSSLDGFGDYLNDQGIDPAAADIDDYAGWFDDKYKDDYTDAYENGQKLLSMSKEATYVDIGLGLEWNDDGTIVSSSAYNSALSGLNFLGFGTSTVTDEDGVEREYSNNLVVLLKQMGDVLKSCDGNTGALPDEWDTNRLSGLVNQIQTVIGKVSTQHVKLSGDTAYLKTNLKQLEDTRDNLNTQFMDLEQGDPAAAIEEYAYARYSYNAALQVGSSILTNTLLDYLR